MHALCVHASADSLSGLEADRCLFVDQHRFTRFRVPTCAGSTGRDRVGSEVTQLDTLAGYQGIRDAVQNGAHDSFAILVVKVGVLRRDTENEVGSDHRRNMPYLTAIPSR